MVLKFFGVVYWFYLLSMFQLCLHLICLGYYVSVIIVVGGLWFEACFVLILVFELL